MKNIPNEYRHLVDGITSIAREILESGEDLLPVVFLGKDGVAPVTLPMLMSSTEAKDRSVYAVRKTAQVVQATYAIMLSEAWGLDHSLFSEEEIKRIAESREGIANHPNRLDLIMITLETPDGFWFAQAPIKSLGKGARSFDDFEFIFLTKAEGRFTSFLPLGVAH